MNKQKIIIAIILLSLTVGLVGYAVKITQNTTDNTGVLISPTAPTNEELESGNKIKEEIVNNSAAETDIQPSKKTNVSVVITDAQQYGETIEVRAFVPNIITNGECSIIFKQNNHTIKKVMPAYAEASSTICTNPEIKRSEFPTPGEWSLIVFFSSEKATGQSVEQKVIIE